MSVLVVIEHDRGKLAPASLEALAAARGIGGDVDALTLGAPADGLATELAAHGATTVQQVHHDLLADYGPEAWGEAVAQATRALQPAAVLACGTDRGNEVMAQAAARLNAPLVVNCTVIDAGEGGSGETWTITRSRWGGSLLERCTVTAPVKFLTVTHHAFEATSSSAAGTVAALMVDLDASLARTVVAERVERAAGVTLSTAALVVGGGRGVGSPEGFAPQAKVNAGETPVQFVAQ